MTRGAFITGSGTGVGKTWVTRGLARAMATRGLDVVAVKPIETGCDPNPSDAEALARACGKGALANASAPYRAEPPVAPLAATMMGHSPPASPAALAYACQLLSADADFLLVEGAGGILVPINEEQNIADLALCLDLPIVLISADALGTLSYTLTAYESARARGLRISAIILTATQPKDPDISTITNANLLDGLIPDCPVLVMPYCEDDDDDALAKMVQDAAILEAVLDPETPRTERPTGD